MEKLLGEFSFGLFIWQTVIVTALILLLRKFAWKPILNTINDREEGIRSAMASAEEARQEMQKSTSRQRAYFERGACTTRRVA